MMLNQQNFSPTSTERTNGKQWQQRTTTAPTGILRLASAHKEPVLRDCLAKLQTFRSQTTRHLNHVPMYIVFGPYEFVCPDNGNRWSKRRVVLSFTSAYTLGTPNVWNNMRVSRTVNTRGCTSTVGIGYVHNRTYIW